MTDRINNRTSTVRVATPEAPSAPARGNRSNPFAPASPGYETRGGLRGLSDMVRDMRAGRENRPQVRLDSGLRRAVVAGDLNAVRQYLRDGANPNALSSGGHSAMHNVTRATRNRAEITEALMAHGGNVTTRTAHSRHTVMHYAMRDALATDRTDVLQTIQATDPHRMMDAMGTENNHHITPQRQLLDNTGAQARQAIVSTVDNARRAASSGPRRDLPTPQRRVALPTSPAPTSRTSGGGHFLSTQELDAARERAAAELATRQAIEESALQAVADDRVRMAADADETFSARQPGDTLMTQLGIRPNSVVEERLQQNPELLGHVERFNAGRQEFLAALTEAERLRSSRQGIGILTAMDHSGVTESEGARSRELDNETDLLMEALVRYEGLLPPGYTPPTDWSNVPPSTRAPSFTSVAPPEDDSPMALRAKQEAIANWKEREPQRAAQRAQKYAERQNQTAADAERYGVMSEQWTPDVKLMPHQSGEYAFVETRDSKAKLKAELARQEAKQAGRRTVQDDGQPVASSSRVTTDQLRSGSSTGPRSTHRPSRPSSHRTQRPESGQRVSGSGRPGATTAAPSAGERTNVEISRPLLDYFSYLRASNPAMLRRHLTDLHLDESVFTDPRTLPYTHEFVIGGELDAVREEQEPAAAETTAPLGSTGTAATATVPARGERMTINIDATLVAYLRRLSVSSPPLFRQRLTEMHLDESVLTDPRTLPYLHEFTAEPANEVREESRQPTPEQGAPTAVSREASRPGSTLARPSSREVTPPAPTSRRSTPVPAPAETEAPGRPSDLMDTEGIEDALAFMGVTTREPSPVTGAEAAPAGQVGQTGSRNGSVRTQRDPSDGLADYDLDAALRSLGE